MSIKNKNKKQQNQDDEDHPVDLTYCFQCDVILSDELKKAEYIGTYTVSNSKSAMSKMIGSQIDIKLKKQEELEKKFEDLIIKKSSKIDLVEEQEIRALNEEIKNCADELKESTNSICKTLAENPDIPSNLFKAKLDRDLIIADLKEFKEDFVNGKFDKYDAIIERIQKKIININEKRTEEMKLFKQLKALNENLAKEENEFNKEQNDLNSQLNRMRKNLAKTKNEEKIFVEYQTNYIDALKNLHLSNFKEKKDQLIKDKEDKLKEKERMQNLYAYVKSFLIEQSEKFKKEKEEWKKKELARAETGEKDRNRLIEQNTNKRRTKDELISKIRNYRDANNHLEEVASNLNYTNFDTIHTTELPPIKPISKPSEKIEGENNENENKNS